MKTRWLLLMVALTAIGCDHEKGASPSASAKPSTSVAPKPPPPWYIGHWSGAYASAIQYFPPMVGPEIAWQRDEGGVAHGTGKLALDIDKTHHVTGKASGPLGKMSVVGTLDGDTLRLRLLPVEKKVGAFTGVLVAHRKNKTSSFEGKLHASSGNSQVVREANVAIAKGDTTPKVKMPHPKKPEGGVDLASEASPHARHKKKHAAPRTHTKAKK